MELHRTSPFLSRWPDRWPSQFFLHLASAFLQSSSHPALKLKRCLKCHRSHQPRKQRLHCGAKCETLADSLGSSASLHLEAVEGVLNYRSFGIPARLEFFLLRHRQLCHYEEFMFRLFPTLLITSDKPTEREIIYITAVFHTTAARNMKDMCVCLHTRTHLSETSIISDHFRGVTG